MVDGELCSVLSRLQRLTMVAGGGLVLALAWRAVVAASWTQLAATRQATTTAIQTVDQATQQLLALLPAMVEEARAAAAAETAALVFSVTQGCV